MARHTAGQPLRRITDANPLQLVRSNALQAAARDAAHAAQVARYRYRGLTRETHRRGSARIRVRSVIGREAPIRLSERLRAWNAAPPRVLLVWSPTGVGAR